MKILIIKTNKQIISLLHYDSLTLPDRGLNLNPSGETRNDPMYPRLNAAFNLL